MALLLTRALRVGCLAAMTMTRHIRCDAAGIWAASFPGEDTKGDGALDYPLDAWCSRLMSDYLSLARPVFPGAGATEQLWMGQKGAMTIEGLKQFFRRRTLAWFGKAYGPHAARKWLRAAAARRAPELVLDVAEICGHTPEVALAHYADSNGLHASLRHGDYLRKLRRANAGRAAGRVATPGATLARRGRRRRDTARDSPPEPERPA